MRSWKIVAGMSLILLLLNIGDVWPHCRPARFLPPIIMK
jgi:hypothetical protein